MTQYKQPKGHGEFYNLTRTVQVSRIILVPTKIEPKEYWEYQVNEVNQYGQNHCTTYYSYNLLALQEHRQQTLAKFNAEKEALYSGSCSQGMRINPTIFQVLKAKNDEKIR